MSPSGPLAGRTIVVTRPQGQAAPLAEAIAAVGGTPLVFPLLEILPADDPQPLADALACLAEYALAVFISPNAVDRAVPAILALGPWPANLQPAAVGPGTAKALLSYGISGCLLPSERFDSDGLLARPELDALQIAGQRVAIFRGDGGRELLGDTLTARGATVDRIACYRRRAPKSFAPLVAAWQTDCLDALLISSSEALRHLWDGLAPNERPFLLQTPVFVPHARIAESARQLGLHTVVLTGATDRGLIDGLLAYNWSA